MNSNSKFARFVDVLVDDELIRDVGVELVASTRGVRQENSPLKRESLTRSRDARERISTFPFRLSPVPSSPAEGREPMGPVK